MNAATLPSGPVLPKCPSRPKAASGAAWTTAAVALGKPLCRLPETHSRALRGV